MVLVQGRPESKLVFHAYSAWGLNPNAATAELAPATTELAPVTTELAPVTAELAPVTAASSSGASPAPG